MPIGRAVSICPHGSNPDKTQAKKRPDLKRMERRAGGLPEQPSHNAGRIAAQFTVRHGQQLTRRELHFDKPFIAAGLRPCPAERLPDDPRSGDTRRGWNWRQVPKSALPSWVAVIGWKMATIYAPSHQTDGDRTGPQIATGADAEATATCIQP